MKQGGVKIQQCVSCFIFNQRPPLKVSHPLKVLLIQREKDPFKGRWTVPGGRQEMNENYLQATQREVKEEVGLDVELLRPERPDFAYEMISPEKYHFLILSSAAVLKSEKIHPEKEDIVAKWFTCGLDPNIIY